MREKAPAPGPATTTATSGAAAAAAAGKGAAAGAGEELVDRAAEVGRGKEAALGKDESAITAEELVDLAFAIVSMSDLLREEQRAVSELKEEMQEHKEVRKSGIGRKLKWATVNLSLLSVEDLCVSFFPFFFFVFVFASPYLCLSVAIASAANACTRRHFFLFIRLFFFIPFCSGVSQEVKQLMATAGKDLVVPDVSVKLAGRVEAMVARLESKFAEVRTWERMKEREREEEEKGGEVQADGRTQKKGHMCHNNR